jgi:hypothetical protein
MRQRTQWIPECNNAQASSNSNSKADIILSPASTNQTDAIGEAREKDLAYTLISSSQPGHEVEYGYQIENRSHQINRMGFAYARCAMLFFFALLITWVCSFIENLPICLVFFIFFVIKVDKRLTNMLRFLPQ